MAPVHPKKATAKKAPAKKKATGLVAVPYKTSDSYDFSVKIDTSGIGDTFAYWSKSTNQWKTNDPDKPLPDLPSFFQIGTSVSSQAWFRSVLSQVFSGLSVHIILNDGTVMEYCEIKNVETEPSYTNTPVATTVQVYHSGGVKTVPAINIRGIYIL